ncbi:MAG: PAS domain S-box protein, partial [Alphaproteobacteria bacterium]|nr:PAS domain S-box protein [Alphaproteobacteria bacterium]
GQVGDVDVFLREIDFNGEPARLAVIIDISARKEAERQTERIFETSQDVIHVTDGFGKFMRVSPSSETVLGYASEELIGRNAQDFIFAEDLELIRNEMRAARRGSVARNFRCRYTHKDGHAVSLAWMAVWSAQDRRHFFIGRDMTEHNRTEEQLRQSQKMEAVGQLTGGVAHDFNNILTVVMANAEALQEDSSRDPELLGRLRAIVAATQRAADLTRHLLAFSRKQLLRPQRTNINALVSGIGRLLGRTLGEHIEISSILADDLWGAEIDRAQLESALLNLSINARDAMPEGGDLLIETRNATLDENYVALNPDAIAGDYVMISVTDTGTGIAPEVLARVYEPFFTTKEVGKGTGLGLSMVYGFIKQSKGHVKIHSELGRGTTVNLYLTRSSSEAEVAVARERQPMPRGSERILVVEDNAEVRAAVVDQLQSLGYSVTEAPDGVPGLATFETMAPPCDLLLTDISMPGAVNGRALADEVGQRWPLTRVVFMSGYAEEAILDGGEFGEGVLLLNKPFSKRELAHILRQALDDTPIGDL